jgi:hypothetical protein
MRSKRLGLAVVVLVTAACATNAGVWNDSYSNMDQKLLRTEVEKTLHADAWTTREENNLLIGEKKDGGGHVTAAIFTFQGADKSSSFELTGKSGHVVNWLTFGILGAATKRKAVASCTGFVEKFQADHPQKR